jgi:hypothetical protein
MFHSSLDVAQLDPGLRRDDESESDLSRDALRRLQQRDFWPPTAALFARANMSCARRSFLSCEDWFPLRDNAYLR